MLLKVDPANRTAERVVGVPLKQFGLDERGFQAVLFKTLDRLLGEEELLLIMQSRSWREEPDLMALDRHGSLYIFEIKVWESHKDNLLQVLRYGQLFGGMDYDALESIWRRSGRDQGLAAAHAAKFDVELSNEQFNNKQVFVVLTNGLDAETRRAIKYWHQAGLDLRPWVYRAYALTDQLFVEISPFRTSDDPLEDQAEGATRGFYVLNTNYSNNPANDAAMLLERKAAAYITPWKHKIAWLKRGDYVFLYRSGEGIVAFGTADGKLKTAPAGDEPDGEYNMSLNEFTQLSRAISASEIKRITENPGLVFRQTMFNLGQQAGKNLLAVARTG